MIGIINMPPESPAEFYGQRPLRSDEAVIFNERKRSKIPEYFFAPDGSRHGLQFQQPQSAETLWGETLQRSIVCRLNGDETNRRRSTSCTNVTVINEPLSKKTSQRYQSSSDGSDESTINSGEATPQNKPLTPQLFISKPHEHRKSSSPLAQAGKFFSISLPKISHLK